MNKHWADRVKRLCVLALIAPTAVNLSGQSLRQQHKEVLEHVERGELAQAEKALIELEATSPQLFRRNSYDYLRGVIRQRSGKLEAAAQDFLSVVERKALLSEYALWHLSEIARAEGKLEVEQRTLNHLLAEAPQSLLYDRARWRCAQSYAASHTYDKAIAVYRAIARGNGRRARAAQLQIGMAEWAQGKAFQARATLEKLLLGRATDDTALSAARILDEIDQRVGAAHRLNDHLRRARIYQANRAFASARRHYRWILEHFPTSHYIPEALWSIGLGYYREGKVDEAIAWFARAAERYPTTPEGEQAAYWIGHAQAQAGRWLKAVEHYERFIAAHPKSQWLPGAHLNAIDALRSAGRPGRALSWCRRTIRRFPGELAATTALFSQARIHLRQDRYRAALKDFDALLKQNLNRPGPRAPNRPEVIFMRGYCLEQLGKYAEAIEAYLSLPEERGSYYGYRATARLHGLMGAADAKKLARARFESFRRRARSALAAGRLTQARAAASQALRLTSDQVEKSKLLDLLKRVYARLPQYRLWRSVRAQRVARGILTRPMAARRRTHRALAGELMFLGLYDEGALELAAALRPEKRRLTRSQLYTLAVALNRGGHPDRTLEVSETYFAPRIPRDYRLELLPRELAETLYPVPYRRLLGQHAAQRNLDPRFVLALMRQESRFRAGAKSSAAARGLLQFVPSTARRLAAAVGKNDFDLADLYHPETSIQLGVAHLEELQQAFPHNLFAVAAAYNAGADSVERWLDRARSQDPDRFVIEIGFRQTKEYVYRVMASYWAYQQIVSDNLSQ